MKKKKRPNKVEQQKKKILLDSILEKWVCVKQIVDDQECYLYIKHRLRDPNSHNRIEQIVLSPEPFECGIYYITEYEIDKILDMSLNEEILEIRPVRFDLEIGLYSEKEKITSFEELKQYLVEQRYVTKQDISHYSNYEQKPPGTQEILLGYNSTKRTM